ncbi:MAG TPA: amidohydrolase family protein [Gemmatimonadales bacterium]
MVRPMLISLALLLPAAVLAQAPTLQPGVRRYVAVDDSVVALVHARVIDGTGAPVVSGQTIVLRGGVIAAVGPDATVRVPASARVIDLAGKTVLPGYVMLHEHLFYPAGSAAYNAMEYSFPRLYLAGGATTIRTGGSRDPYGDLNVKRAIDAGRTPGPTVYVTGPYLNGPGLPINFVHAVADAAEARRMVAYWADMGATSFKVYMQISRDELRAVVEEAHARGLTVTGHLCSVTFREAAAIGIDDLEHGLMASTDFVADKQPDQCPSGNERNRSLQALDPTGPDARQLIEHLVRHRVAITSTLPVFETSVPGRPVAPAGALDAMSPQARDQYLRSWARAQTGGPDVGERFAHAMAFEHAFATAGGLLVSGTDPTGFGGVVAGYANQREVELLVEAGFAPEGAIRIATSNGARFLGIADRVGTIAAGKSADLIVVDGNPAARIQDIRNVAMVFKAGMGYDPARLIADAQGLVGIR